MSAIGRGCVKTSKRNLRLGKYSKEQLSNARLWYANESHRPNFAAVCSAVPPRRFSIAFLHSLGQKQTVDHNYYALFIRKEVDAVVLRITGNLHQRLEQLHISNPGCRVMNTHKPRSEPRPILKHHSRTISFTTSRTPMAIACLLLETVSRLHVQGLADHYAQ